jgi:hypothetical protein
MTAVGLVCGPCGTELSPNAKSYNESAVPSYRAQSCCAINVLSRPPLTELPGEPHSRQIEWDPPLIIGVSD